MQSASPTTPRALLSVAEIAELLGVDDKTIRRMRRRGALPPALEIGGVIHWEPATVDAWLAERREAAR